MRALRRALEVQSKKIGEAKRKARLEVSQVAVGQPRVGLETQDVLRQCFACFV